MDSEDKLFGFVALLLAIVFIILIVRIPSCEKEENRHAEKMKMIEHGMQPLPEESK